ncbi:aryl hydrocarbon receptor-like isoform X2 [Acipenser oxyrinchus oxyrinchus]|uniref:Aryl hydrocarbon receptor-like isoform X2 n=1 Tax=Acipenser oxyrinchus oxyrinchus TaxID=40147 RepID=A0AAD8D407_ACIOX|nr:aryl hydrocarbon receptor-like isoform X2 [Acipenser oxyrinchus oxyrinchus]
MMNTTLYAGRKRSRPVRGKPLPVDRVKMNPSKRHRDRLNTELEHLASLLPFPEHITNKLDKLSIMRLAVSFLRAKTFFGNALQKKRQVPALPPPLTVSQASISQEGVPSPGFVVPEGDLLLQAVNGFVLVVTGEGTIFYTSHTIQDHLGFHQSDVINQSVDELIHTEDREEFDRQLHWALDPPKKAGGEGYTSDPTMLYQPTQLPPENSPFLDRSFVCRMRCLLDSSSGFLTLHCHGKLKFLNGMNRKSQSVDKAPSQLALFAIAVPVQPPAIMEIRTRSLAFRSKHQLDFSPISIDAKGKLLLGWTEAELKAHSGYHFIHFEDILYCAENHLKIIKTGDSGVTVFRLLTKKHTWIWITSIARVTYKDDKPDCIIATQRPLTDAEGEEHLLKRAKHDKFLLDKQSLLYNSSNLLSPQASRCHQQVEREGHTAERHYNPSSILAASLHQNQASYIYRPSEESAPFLSPSTTPSSSPGLQTKKATWPEVPADVSIREMLWQYGLSQEDLELIQMDETIARMGEEGLSGGILNTVAQVSPGSSSTSLSFIPSTPSSSSGSDNETRTLSSSPDSSSLSWEWMQERSSTASCYTVAQENKSGTLWPSFMLASGLPVPVPDTAMTSRQMPGAQMSSLLPPPPTSNSNHSALLTMLLAQIPTKHKIQTTLSCPLPSNGAVTRCTPFMDLSNTWPEQGPLPMTSSSLLKHSWPLTPPEDPQNINMAHPGEFLPHGITNVYCPDHNQSLLCTGLSCASVQ